LSAVSTTDIAGAKPPDDPIPHPRSGRQTSRMNIENRQGVLNLEYDSNRSLTPEQLDHFSREAAVVRIDLSHDGATTAG
jgi:hypothetical protein